MIKAPAAKTSKEVKHGARAKPLNVQTKMEVGAANDPFEYQADRMASHVMGPQATSAPPPTLSSIPRASPQRKASTMTRPEDEHRPPPTTIRREAAGSDAGFSVSQATEAAIVQAQRSGGQALNATSRNFFEPRMGHDLSDVRIHNTPEAHDLSRELHAKAFTVDQDVFFAQGQYAPGTRAGDTLMAHELAHTLQQSRDVQTKRIRRTENTGLIPITTVALEDLRYTNPGIGSVDFSRPPTRPQKRGTITLPSFPVALVNVSNSSGGVTTGVVKGAANTDINSAKVDLANPPIPGTISGTTYKYTGAPHGRRFRNVRSAYKTWDTGAQQLSGYLATRIPTQITRSSNPPGLTYRGDEYFYLTAKATAPTDLNDIMFGTADDLSKARYALRPVWPNKSLPGNSNRRTTSFDADHSHELQFGGEDSFANMWLWDARSNRQFGQDANDHVNSAIERLRSAMVSDARFPYPQKESFPQSTTEVRDNWHIEYLRLQPLNLQGRPDDHYTQKDIQEGVQFAQLRELSDTELTGAGLRPPAGSTVNYMNLFFAPGGGRRFRIQETSSGIWTLASGHHRNTRNIQGLNRHRQANSRQLESDTSFELMNYIEDHGIGNPTNYRGRIRGVIFRRLVAANVLTVPNPVSEFRVKQADVLGYSLLPYATETNRRRDGFAIKGLSPLDINESGFSSEGDYYVTGNILPNKMPLVGMQIPIHIVRNEIYVDFPLPAEDLKFGPFRVDYASLQLGYSDGFFFRGLAAISVDKLGSGTITAQAGENTAKISGDFNFDMDFLDPANVNFEYDLLTDALSMSGTLGVQDGKIPGIKSGEVVVSLVDNEISLNGTLNPKGFLEGAQMTLVYSKEEGVKIELRNYRPPMDKVPGVKNAVVNLGVQRDPETESWRFFGDGTAQFDIPDVTGQMRLAVDNDLYVFEGEGVVQKGPAMGSLRVKATNQKLDSEGQPIEGETTEDMRITGRGQATMTFGIITATAGLTYDDGEISVDGELALPPTHELFPARRYDKELFSSPRVTFPIWGFSLAGFTIGISGFVDAKVNFDAHIGPATLNDTRLTAVYTFSKPEETVIDGSANLNLTAGAGLKLDVGGGIIAGAAIADVSGRIGIAAGLGFETNVGADLNIHWTPADGFSFTTEAYANVSPKFNLGINASVTASAGVGPFKASHTFGPWDKQLGEFGPDMKVEARFPVGWSEKDGLDFDLAKATITEPDIDFKQLTKDAFLELV